ncbi:MAG: GGDEF domain-containing protein [Saccharofermentans sp.]|nr:GGDEF domain-containing protein [Saccharofermentans sp.]
MSKRLNIGLLIDDIDNYFSNQACKGAELAAKALDANLFIFPGHYIGKPDSKYADKEYEYQYNSIYSLPSSRNVDIIYILQGTICSRASFEEQKAFLKSLPKVPIVCLFSNFEGYNSVTFDNSSGLGRAIYHLIDKHNAKNIGYVSGPITNRDASERLEVYKQCLESRGIPVEDSKIVYGDFTENSSEEVYKLLDNNAHLDAIVFANDSMAIGGYTALYDRGILPGKDILVTGFDDDSFSVSLHPPLTTVEASSADLTYKAVLNAQNYINHEQLSDMSVETHLVQRSSCGCDGLDVADMSKWLHFNDIETGDNEAFIEHVKRYLFGIFVDDGPITDIKARIGQFCKAYSEFLTTDDKQKAVEMMDKSFAHILQTDLLVYTTPEKFFNILQTMQYEAEQLLKDTKDDVIMNNMFSDFYRLLSFSGLSITRDINNKSERLSRMVNQQTGDIFLMSSDNDIPFEHLLGGLYSVGFKKSLLYLFQGNVHNNGETANWRCPNSMLLKAISDDRGIRTMSDEQQLLRTDLLFTNEFIEGDSRRTMVVCPLFVGADLYGLLVNELDCNNLSNVSTVAFQLSVTLKSLIMIEEQNKAKQNLQNSLERFIRDNTKLDEIAKQDELTGLFNRRGFLFNAEKALGDPLNIGKTAVICYADMDNLKMVNDKFGHDEGDFSLRTIAKVLRESFRGADIIGRMGGDEFVVLAIIGSDCDTSDIKTRIDKVTARYNKQANKPYPIGMSTGLYKFICNPKIDIFEIIDRADGLLYEEKLEKRRKYGSYR